MLRKTDIAYIAGLFDGEGSITYKKYKSKKTRNNKTKYYDCWRIVMEITMTDASVFAHYKGKVMNDKIVDMVEYKKVMNLE
jgi:hypothetical protein